MKFLICTTFHPETRIFDALSSIKGLGKSLSLQICEEVGLSPQLELRFCLSKDLDKVTDLVSDSFVLNEEVEQMERKAKARLRYISAYRSFRYTLGLPCRGQRTRTNSITSRKLSLSKPNKEKKGVARAIKSKI